MAFLAPLGAALGIGGGAAAVPAAAGGIAARAGSIGIYAVRTGSEFRCRSAEIRSRVGRVTAKE